MFWTTAALLVTLAIARVSSTSPISGEITDTDVNIPEVKDALNFAVGEFNRQNDVYIYKVVKVITANSQVVSGTMYRFEVEMTISGCKPSPQEICVKNNSELKKPYTCYFEVWSQPWLGQPKLMKNVCKH